MAELSTAVVGCWVALTDANPTNGCMTVLRGAHRTADGAPNPLRHYQKRDWMISDEDVLGFPPRGARPPFTRPILPREAESPATRGRSVDGKS